MGLAVNIGVILLVFSLVFFAGCSSCPSPIREACAEKAAQIAPELAKVAAEQHKTPDEMTTEFRGACEGRLQYDLDQTLPDILAVLDADAGTADGAP